MNRQFRKFTIGILTAITACGLAPQALAEIMLKKSIVVQQDFVTFGDLFDDESFLDNEEARLVRIARSPAPGKLSQLSPGRVRAAAAKHGLHWRNVERVQRISVKRASDTISSDEIKAAVAKAIEERGVSGKIQVKLPSQSAKLHVAKGSAPELVVRLDDFDPARKFFRGELAAINEDGQETVLRISGRAISVMSIPVLNQSVRPGDVISDGDIEWVEYPSDRVSGNMITDATQLVGMSPKRSLRTSFPLRTGDVRLPIVAPKGSAVTVLFDQPGISLSISGRAMEDGARGQLIRIQNLRSNRIVEAEVIGPGKVRIAGTSFRPI